MTTQPNGVSGTANGSAAFSDKLPMELIDKMQALFGGKHPGYRTST